MSGDEPLALYTGELDRRENERRRKEGTTGDQYHLPCPWDPSHAIRNLWDLGNGLHTAAVVTCGTCERLVELVEVRVVAEVTARQFSVRGEAR